MGFKLLKKVYKIEHLVQVSNLKEYGGEVICIGSPYIYDLIVIDKKGNLLKRYKGSESVNANLYRYQKEFDEDMEKLKRIVETPDNFDIDDLKNVYIYDNFNGCIREELCEKYGWPNTTTKGELLYNNTSYKTYSEALKYAIKASEYDKYIRNDNRERLSENLMRLKKTIFWIFRRRWIWFKVRTILRLKNIFIKN